MYIKIKALPKPSVQQNWPKTEMPINTKIYILNKEEAVKESLLEIGR